MSLIILNALLCAVFLCADLVFPALLLLALLTAQGLRLYRQSGTDPLTGLGNLRRLDSRRRRYSRCRRIRVYYFDMDCLKQVNDTHGHSAGDRKLTEMAALLQEAAGNTADAYRVGGDEFLLIGFDGNHEPDLKALAGFPVSYGCACGSGDSLDDLIRQADRALYRNRSVSAE